MNGKGPIPVVNAGSSKLAGSWLHEQIQDEPLRAARILQACAWLGMKLDADANSATDCAVSAWVIPTNEELMIARHTCAHVASRHAD